MYDAPRTDHEMTIQQVAGIISDQAMDPDMAERVNRGDGWSFDVRWPSRTYTSESDWTHVDGCRLSEEDLRAAIDLAEEWLADLERSPASRRGTTDGGRLTLGALYDPGKAMLP